jgi:hypothetical protein
MTLSKLGQHLMGIAFALLMGFVLMGCSLYPDVNTDPTKNNLATFRQDALDCAHSYPESGSGVHIKQRISCMNLKGWH